MNNFLKHVPGFRTNNKGNTIVAILYYGYCIYSIPSRSFIASIIWFALPFVIFAVGANSKTTKAKLKAQKNNPVEFTKTVKTYTPIVFTKKLTGIIVVVIIALLGFGAYSASARTKKDAKYAFEQKVVADAEIVSNNKAKAIADKQAVADKKIADDVAKGQADVKAKVVKIEADKMNSDILYYSQVKAKEIFKERLVKVEKDTKGILITFKLSDNFSMKMVGDGGFIDSGKLFALYKGHTGDYTDVTCLGTYPMKDKYGTVTDDTIFAITLDKDTIQKTTFENLDPTTDLKPLSSSNMIRPELTK